MKNVDIEDVNSQDLEFRDNTSVKDPERKRTDHLDESKIERVSFDVEGKVVVLELIPRVRTVCRHTGSLKRRLGIED